MEGAQIIPIMLHSGLSQGISNCSGALQMHQCYAVQVAVLTKDSERLVAENNHLHLRIIQETDKHTCQEREHLAKQKKLEDTVADLCFFKSSMTDRHAALERENAGLRAKMQELLHGLDARQRADSEGENGPFESLQAMSCSACCVPTSPSDQIDQQRSFSGRVERSQTPRR